jgi:hypothetical protein
MDTLFLNLFIFLSYDDCKIFWPGERAVQIFPIARVCTSMGLGLSSWYVTFHLDQLTLKITTFHLKDFPQVDSQLISSWGSTGLYLYPVFNGGSVRLKPPAKLCMHRSDAKSAAAHHKQPLAVHSGKDIEILGIILREGFNCMCYSAVCTRANNVYDLKDLVRLHWGITNLASWHLLGGFMTSYRKKLGDSAREAAALLRS